MNHVMKRTLICLIALTAALVVAVFAMRVSEAAISSVSGPGDTSDGSAVFTFSADTPSTFECKFLKDGVVQQNWSSCSSPKTYSNLADGSYAFRLRATDSSGVSPVDSTAFTVVNGGTSVTQCADNLDNDGDGLVDLGDPGCANSADDDETNAVPTGAELIGAGDIADGGSGAAQTAGIIKNHPNASVFNAGDNAYETGSLSEYQQRYNPSWGDFKGRTNPTPGNHEYKTSGASGYFSYFGAAAKPSGNSYYAKNVGDWRIYYLDSNIGATSTSAQYSFVQKDLAANPRTCSAAIWHYPVASSGEHGNLSKMKAVFALLDSKGVDVVINGHDHNYERFARINSSGAVSSNGIQEFVVGTGGTSELRPMNAAQPGSQVRIPNAWGVLDLKLNSSSYTWEWIRPSGSVGDSGSMSCMAN